MGGDLDYFYESDLDQKNLKYFYDSLPNHLKYKFRVSLHCQIHKGNVLQGYRGPSNMCNNGSGDSGVLNPSHGLQEIKFWWAARKDMNFVPLVGTGWYGCERGWQSILGHTDWSSLYFDSKTGECLSHDRDEALRILTRRRKEAKLKKQAASSSSDSRNDEHGSSESKAESSNYDSDNSDECDCRGCRNRMRRSNYDSDDYIRRAQNYQRRDYQDKLLSMEKNREMYSSDFFEQGNFFFHEGMFDEAENKFREAYQTSRVYEHRRLCYEGLEAVRTEKNAKLLNSQGDDLYDDGEYQEAKDKYEQAFRVSKVDAQRRLYEKNIKKAQTEIDAKTSYSEGNRFFAQHRYRDAENEYQAAFDKSKSKRDRQDYMVMKNRANCEAEAAECSERGKYFFNCGDYKKAYNNYQKAFQTSQINTNRKMYEANMIKAQAEIEAINFNSLGNDLYKQGKYNEADSKYKDAYDKSQITMQKNIYSKNREKTQTIMKILKSLDQLWKEAWDAENDTKNDRSEEATALFQKVLKQSKDALEMFPGNSEFEKYKTLALLKIEGNELFNQGLESQETGTTLFQEAWELKLQQKYKQADTKFKEASNYFQKALEKFEIGRQKDKESTRFVSSIKIVQEQINEVKKSIEIIEQLVLSAGLHGLNIAETVSVSNSQESDVTGKHNDYSQHT